MSFKKFVFGCCFLMFLCIRGDFVFGNSIYQISSIDTVAYEDTNKNYSIKNLFIKIENIIKNTMSKDEFKDLIIELNKTNTTKDELILVSADALPDFWKFYAITGYNARMMPSNANDIDWNKFYKDFPFKYVLSDNEYILNNLRLVVNLQKTEYKNLWLVLKKETK